MPYNFIYPAIRINPEYRFDEVMSGYNYNFSIISGITSGISGGTFDNIIVSGYSDLNILSANTIYSAGTDLYDIFITTDQNDITRVQPGVNIYTGGTDNYPTINLSDNIFINDISISGNTIINALTASTYYSGSTPVENFFVWNIQGGSNIETGGTANQPIISLSDNIFVNDITASGNTILSSTTATTLYTDYIRFNTGYTHVVDSEGKMFWDEENQTISVDLHPSGGVSLQLGQETYYLIKNQSGATIENGKVIRAAGTLGASGRILGEYMIADGTIPAKYTLGIATQDILSGDDGYVTEFGLVRGINTTGVPYGEVWNDGDILWASPTIQGGLTNVEPSAPNLAIEIAIVVHAASNGSIFVRPHRYPTTNELQDVVSTGETQNDILQWNTSLSAYTNTNTPTFTSLSAATVSGGTIYSGSTDLYDIFSTSAGVTGSGTPNVIPIWNGATTLTDSIMSFDGTSGITVAGDVFIQGNVEVLGTATTINTNDLYVKDNTITLNSGGTHTSANGGGIFIEDGVTDGTYSTWTIDGSGNWSANTSILSQGINVQSGAIQSGGTDLYSIFALVGSGDVTRVQPGINTFTGGTANEPTINVTGLTIDNITVSGASSFGSISANTFYSGSTNLLDIFLTLGDLSGTSVSAGSNISVVNVGTDYEVSVVDSPSFNNVSFSGVVNGGDVIVDNISATTIFSGSTDLSDLFLDWTLQSDFSAHTGDTNNPHSVTAAQVGAYTTSQTDNLLNTKADLSGATFTGGVYATTLSGGTIYSGGTDLSEIFAPLGSDTNNYVTGFTYDNANKLTVSVNNGNNYNAIINQVTGLTFNGNANFTDSNNYITNNGGQLEVHFDDTFAINNDALTAYMQFDSALSIGANGSIPTISSNDSGSGDGYELAANLLTGYRNFEFPNASGTFALTSDLDVTRVQPGTNITTGGTANEPIVNLADSITINSVSATTISGGTIYSGSTDLYNIFALAGSDTNNYVTGFTYDNANKLTVSVNDGNDYSAVIDQLTGLTVNGALTATTIYSGSTDLSDLFLDWTLQTDFNAHTGDTNNPHSVTAAQVGAYTIAQTDNLLNTKADLSGATFTGGIYAPTLSGGTIYSGGTDLYSIFSTTDTNIANSDLTISSTGIRKLILGGTGAGDIFSIRNNGDTLNYFSVQGNGISNLGTNTVNIGQASVGNTVSFNGNDAIITAPSANYLNLVSGYRIAFKTYSTLNAQLDSYALYLYSHLSLADGKDIFIGGTNGTKIGTATSSKIGFWNATPVVQPSSVTTAQGLADALTSIGLLATGSTIVDASDITRVQPGINTFTGGTANEPTVNVTGLTIDNINVSGSSIFTSLSAGTIYSGSTDLYNIFALAGSDTNNYVTGFTYDNANKLTVSVNDGNDYSAVIDQLTGLTVNGALSATTIFSGATDLSDLFLDWTLQTDFNAHTGDTNNPHSVTAAQVGAYTTSQTDNLLNTKANLSGATFTGGVFAPSLSATTIYSGSTDLSNLFAPYGGGGIYGGSGTVPSGVAVSITDTLNFDSNTLFINASTNRVGIGTAAPSSTMHVNGTLTSGNIVISNPGTGNTSQINFAKTSDTAQINVTEYSPDQTLYEFYMADNPDTTSDIFHWAIRNYQQESTGWKPLKFAGFQTQFVAEYTDFWSSLRVPNSAAYYTTNKTSDVNKYQPYISNSYAVALDSGSGTGTFNVEISGFSGTTDRVYWVEIDGANTFKWGVGPSTSVTATGVTITGGFQYLDQGAQIKITGSYALADHWSFRAFPAPKITFGNITSPTEFFTVEGTSEFQDNVTFNVNQNTIGVIQSGGTDLSDIFLTSADIVNIGNSDLTITDVTRRLLFGGPTTSLQIRNSGNTENLFILRNTGEIQIGDNSYDFTSTVNRVALIGNANTQTTYNPASYVTVFGHNNTLDSYGRFNIFGDNNSVNASSGGEVVVVGYNNLAGGGVSGNVIVGQGNNVYGDANVVIGYNNQTQYEKNNSVIIGSNLKVNLAGNKQLFKIGYGATATALSQIDNSFELYLNGTSNSDFFIGKNTNLVISNNTTIAEGTHYETAASNTLTMRTGVTPTSNIVDSYVLYADDVVPGNAAPHFRTEGGDIVKLYTEGAVTTAQGIADALTNIGLLASSTINDSNNYVTGFTYDGSNNFTISVNDGNSYTAGIDTMSGLTINGDLILSGSAAPSLNTTANVTANIGQTTVYSVPAADYTGAFFDYIIVHANGARSGNVMAIWSGTSAVQFSETSTNDIGDSSDLTFDVAISGSDILFRASANTNSWTVKTIVRTI